MSAFFDPRLRRLLCELRAIRRTGQRPEVFQVPEVPGQNEPEYFKQRRAKCLTFSPKLSYK